jgi:hypothetical protein
MKYQIILSAIMSSLQDFGLWLLSFSFYVCMPACMYVCSLMRLAATIMGYSIVFLQHLSN